MIRALPAGLAGSSRRVNTRQMLMIGLVSATAVALAFAVVAITRGEAGPSGQALSPADFEQATGMEVIRVVLTAGGGALDIRYRVTDASKASAHSGGHMAPLTVESESGEVLQIPFGMHTRGPTYKDGHVYYELLVNGGGAVNEGDHVVVVVHDARLSDVVVQ